jgi:hypothetical protein
MSEKKFYVYVHRYASGPKQGDVFYVGKGTGSRSNSLQNRNKKWHNFVNKYGFSSEICQDCMSEYDSFTLEMWLISKYRHCGVNLANLTGGGDGIREPSKSTRIKMSKSATGRKASVEAKEKMRIYQTGRKHPESVKAKISIANKGKTLTKETKLILSELAKSRYGGVNNPRHDKTLRYFYHDDYGLVCLTKYEWRTKYNISISSCYNLITGKWKIAKGWTILDGELDRKKNEKLIEVLA